MSTEDKKYDGILKVLKNSKPVLNDAEAIADKVIRQIRSEKSEGNFADLLIGFFFGWVYVGWVRKSLVAGALVLFALFAFQQTLIIKRINELSGQKIRNEFTTKTNYSDEVYQRKILYSIMGKKPADAKIPVSQKELDHMIKSVNKLRLKYHDLFELIENDPELRKYVEEKLIENRLTKSEDSPQKKDTGY